MIRLLKIVKLEILNHFIVPKLKFRQFQKNLFNIWSTVPNFPFSYNFRNDDENDDSNKAPDPFKPTTGHIPGGLPMMSDSAFSLCILIYVSVAFLLVFFLFCWKTNNGNGNYGELVKECPLMTNDIPNQPIPKVIPPTPSCENKFVDIEMNKIGGN